MHTVRKLRKNINKNTLLIILNRINSRKIHELGKKKSMKKT